MEIILTQQTGTQVSVTCDGQFSHLFDLVPLLISEEQALLRDPVTYGARLYEALFPAQSLARRILATLPERILLVPIGEVLDALAWEYVSGPDGFLVCDCPFVRGLPEAQRIDAPSLDQSLHMVAIPSQPLDADVPALDIDGEWLRLKESIQEVASAITLERVRPPTLEQTRLLVANQRHLVLHFMGHGGQNEQGALLCFEQENGALEAITARQLTQRVRGAVFLVTLNACASAMPGATPFSNLAAALARQRAPYALGMRFSIPDDDARAFSRAFYSELARGVSVEEALFQARLTLARSPRPWIVGVPVLYTTLTSPAPGFRRVPGTPVINEHQPKIEVNALPRAEGAFQGRIDELKQIGMLLTGDSRPRILTIHGGGGQGKTALAREAAERFAFAWPGGVWATSFENLPGREVVVADLARFLGIEAQETLDPARLEPQVQALLHERRLLIVLDNAETLIEAVEANDEAALRLAEWVRQLPGSSVSLLVTSRVLLGWPGEVSCELGGLSPTDGALLFRQSAPQRYEEVEMPLAQQVSEKVDGQPLGLRLLGGAFNASAITLSAFLAAYEEQLVRAENKYVGLEHRHRTLFACIETSVRSLDADLRAMLSGLWIFHAAFVPEAAVAIFDPDCEETEQAPSAIRDHLFVLWQRGLLARQIILTRDGRLTFYRLLSVMRPYMEQDMPQALAGEVLRARFGAAYLRLIINIGMKLNTSAAMVAIAQQTREDLERGATYVTGKEQGYYLLHLSVILDRLGNPRRGLALIERTLEIAQGQDQQLELQALNAMAIMYQATGQLEQALYTQEQAVSSVSRTDYHEEEAAIRSNQARTYNLMGQPQKALEQYEAALSIWRRIGQRAGEAATLNSMADVYRALGQLQRAQEFGEAALPLMRAEGDRSGEAHVLNSLGRVCLDRGDARQALTILQEAVSLCREVGDRAWEAATLINIALAYDDLGQVRQAFPILKEALAIKRAVGDRSGEAVALNNMGLLYEKLEQPGRALEFYEQSLPIRREIKDRRGEAATLLNMAGNYRASGQLQRALEVGTDALSIVRQVEAHPWEAIALATLADVYRDMQQWPHALECYNQALQIHHDLENRVGIATTLNKISTLWWFAGQWPQALEACKAALPIWQGLGDQATAASVLNNMARLYQTVQQPQQALTCYEQALALRQEIGDRAGAASTLYYLAVLLYQQLNRPQEAIERLGQAIMALLQAGLQRDKSGNTIEDMQRQLQAMQADNGANDGS